MRTRALLPLFFAAALTACGSGSTPAGAPTGSKSAPGTSTPSATESAPPSGAASPSATARPALPAPPVPPRSERENPPAPGLYRYSQSGKTSAAGFSFDEPGEGTLTIHPATSAGTAKRQESERRYSDSRTRLQTLLFRSGGVYLEEVVTRFTSIGGTQEFRCEPAEPLLLLRNPLKVGAGWFSVGACEGVSFSIDVTVLRTEKRTVGDARISTTVVRITSKVESDDMKQTSTSHMWISPDYRLVVHAEERSEGTYGGAPFTADLTESLVSLAPEPVPTQP